MQRRFQNMTRLQTAPVLDMTMKEDLENQHKFTWISCAEIHNAFPIAFFPHYAYLDHPLKYRWNELRDNNLTILDDSDRKDDKIIVCLTVK